MNLADYLSELLGLYDEVSVPGLGYFVRVRVNAHYNEKEARFYPPYHQVKFVPQPKDDDIFTQYIADKKNISLASSKYFAEKFISKLKEDAARGKFLFADLGAFQTEQDQLVFKPNEKIPADPAFYGYPQVNVYKLGQPLYPEHAKPVFAETTQRPAAITPPEQAIEQQYYEEDAEPKRRLSIWLILLIAFGVIALGLFAVYKFYPQAFDKVKSLYHSVVDKQDASVPVSSHEAKVEPPKKAVIVNDTTAKTVAAVDTTARSHWEIIAGTYANQQVADAAVVHFRRLGVVTRALNLTEAAGPYIKVSAGSYPTNEDAETTRLRLVKEHKLLPSSYSIEIKPKK